MDDQKFRVALITGGTSGLGKSAAIELARKGWSVFLQYSSEQESADEALADITAAGQKTAGSRSEIEAFSFQADLSVASQREQLVEAAVEQFGQIDLLVNCPSFHTVASADLLELSQDTYRQVMETIVEGTLFFTQLIANEMVRLVEAGQIENPKIVTINSISAYTTSVDHGPHCIARSALAMMTKLFADSLGEHGVNVYELRTGIISAGALDSAHAKYDDLISQGLTPLRRWGRPEDVSRAITAIAQDLLPFSTGEVINVDGGFHLRRL